jgi:hypothetical protein
MSVSRRHAGRAGADPAVRWSVGSCERTDQGSANGRHAWRPCRARGSTVGIQLVMGLCSGGDEETRTPDPLLAKEMLCQLSYVPAERSTTVVGVSGLEPETSALSGQRSNQLS